MTAKGNRTATPKYATVHIWLKLDNGSPSQFPCHFCGGRATEWVCFRNKTEKEYRQGAWVAYSKNTEDYVAGCRPCNMELDKPPRELCVNGHDDWVSNGIRTRNGKTKPLRKCRTCDRLRVQKRRGKAE